MYIFAHAKSNDFFTFFTYFSFKFCLIFFFEASQTQSQISNSLEMFVVRLHVPVFSYQCNQLVKENIPDT